VSEEGSPPECRGAGGPKANLSLMRLTGSVDAEYEHRPSVDFV